MHRHLGGGVQRHIRAGLPQELRHAQVLDQDRVDPQPRRQRPRLRRQRKLPVLQQRVQRQIDPHAPQMAVGHGLLQLFLRKVFRVPPGVERAEAQIHCVRPTLYRRDQGFLGLGRGGLGVLCLSLRFRFGFGLGFPLGLGLFLGGLAGLPLHLRHLLCQPGVFVQGLLQLGPQVVRDQPLLAVFVRHVHGRQHRPVGDGEGVAVHGVVHLFVDDVGALLQIVLVLLRQKAVALVVDVDRHFIVCHDQ